MDLSELSFDKVEDLVFIELLIKNRALLPPLQILVTLETAARFRVYFGREVFHLYENPKQDFSMKVEARFASAETAAVRLKFWGIDEAEAKKQLREIVPQATVQRRVKRLIAEASQPVPVVKQPPVVEQPDLSSSEQPEPAPKEKKQNIPFDGIPVHTLPAYAQNLLHLRCTGETGAELCPACGFFYSAEDSECVRCGFYPDQSLIHRRHMYVFVGHQKATLTQQYRRLYRPAPEQAITEDRSSKNIAEEYTVVSQRIHSS